MENRTFRIFPGSRLATSSYEPKERTGIKRPYIPRLVPVRPISSYNVCPFKEMSPWDCYHRAFDLDLAGVVSVVSKIPATSTLYILRSFIEPEHPDDKLSAIQKQEKSALDEKKIYMLRQLNHVNILKACEIFSYSDTFYVVSEYQKLSLAEFLIEGPDETELVAIVHQILNGLAYLESLHLIHGSINRPNILLSDQGTITIGMSLILVER